MVNDAQESDALPFYRYREALRDAHFYTLYPEELNGGDLPLRGYVSEGHEGYAWPLIKSDIPNMIALHRYYNTFSRDHFYTTLKELRNTPSWDNIKNGNIHPGVSGYNTEGTACFVVDDLGS
jgi:hypothetical protein